MFLYHNKATLLYIAQQNNSNDEMQPEQWNFVWGVKSITDIRYQIQELEQQQKALLQKIQDLQSQSTEGLTEEEIIALHTNISVANDDIHNIKAQIRNLCQDITNALQEPIKEIDLFWGIENITKPTIEQIEEFIPQATALVLEEEKEKKLEELDTIYSSPQIWEMTITDTKDGVEYALTRSQEWFVQQTPLLTIGLIDNKGNPYFRTFNTEKEALIFKTNISLFGLQMRTKKMEVAKKIQGIKTLEKLNALDIAKEFPELKATVDELIVLKS